jgi:hypothetical protein
MAGTQLPLFQRKTYKGIIPTIPVEIQAPTVDKTVIQTLPAYYSYLQSGGFSKYTPDDFTGDLKKFGVFQKEKPIKGARSQGNNPWQTQVMALFGAPLAPLAFSSGAGLLSPV